MAVDPDVLGVLGGWSRATAQAAIPAYERYGLAILVPGAEMGANESLLLGDRAFVEGFEALSGGVPPGPLAAWAYSTAVRLLDAVDTAVRAEGQPSRADVRAALEADHKR
jgi:ABC-type branched-subunit amino acid transport system substrate-binding protein